jgi:hypothetical protein
MLAVLHQLMTPPSVEQRKLALKKVGEELDEAEEIVSIRGYGRET